MQALTKLRRAGNAGSRSLVIFASDVGRGLLEVSHNTLALVGLAAVAVLVFAAGRADVRHQVEVVTLEWLQVRHEERELASGNLLSAVAEPDAGGRATPPPQPALARAPAPRATGV